MNREEMIKNIHILLDFRRRRYYRMIERQYTSYDSMYLFTTEKIKEYMPSLSGKEVLSVCSSGDHYFEAILRGASIVDVFDINFFAKFLFLLKKAAIETLSLEQFQTFFGFTPSFWSIFDYHIYDHFLRDQLDSDTKWFWDYLYDAVHYDGFKIYESQMIRPTGKPSDILTRITYQNPLQYSLLQQRLVGKSSEFIFSEIHDLATNITKNYDYIFLSNIQQYQDAKEFLKVIRRLMNYLKKDGSLYFAYVYNTKVLLNRYMPYERLLKRKNYHSFSFDGVVGTDKIFYYKK